LVDANFVERLELGVDKARNLVAESKSALLERRFDSLSLLGSYRLGFLDRGFLALIVQQPEHRDDRSCLERDFQQILVGVFQCGSHQKCSRERTGAFNPLDGRVGGGQPTDERQCTCRSGIIGEGVQGAIDVARQIAPNVGRILAQAESERVGTQEPAVLQGLLKLSFVI
jgi:hypothetical protein